MVIHSYSQTVTYLRCFAAHGACLTLTRSLNTKPKAQTEWKPTMEPGQPMDLISLMRHVPALLSACTRDHVTRIRALRQVNREARIVALLGLKSYRLTLQGYPGDTNVRAAEVLQAAVLNDLHVSLQVSGE